MGKQQFKQQYRVESSVYHKFNHNVPGMKNSLGETRIGIVSVSMIESKEFDFSILFPKTIKDDIYWRDTGEANSYWECIKTCKEIPHYYRGTYKRMIYAIDYAVYVFLKHNNYPFKQKLIIEPIFESMGINGFGMAIATINGIWRLLNFYPDKEHLPEVIDYEITIHNDFIPRWVERDLKQNPNEAFEWAGIDEDLYESSSRYKWIV